MAEPLSYIQESFAGGLNQQVDATRIARNEYVLLINGRNRYDVIRPIKRPQKLTDGLPSTGNYQGVYSAGSIAVVFIAGQAYFRDFSVASGSFSAVPDFQMTPTAETIFAELVPASTVNFARVPAEASNKKTDVALTTPISASPQVMVVQDGVLQPRVITTTMTSRITQTYAEWQADGIREYVPVGNQMLYQDGKLYVVSPDKRRILHSVSGRPIDFMVNITATGDKLPLESEGGADSVSHVVDYGELTCISRLNTDNGGFFASTSRASWMVIPSFVPEDLVFGEPTFSNIYLFSTGAINNFSFIELLGDHALVDFNGLRSFNAILQVKNEGKNSPFSVKVGPILQSIQQNPATTAAINFDNYALFAVETIYGPAVIVYDTLSESFVGLDIYSGVGTIKQFCEIKTDAGRKLLFITTNNELYEAFASTETEAGKLYVGEWATNDPSIEQKVSQLKVVVSDSFESGLMTASLFVDRKFVNSLNWPVQAVSSLPSIPIDIPFNESGRDTVLNLPFDFGRSIQGWKFGFLLSWDFDCIISHIGVTAGEEKNISSVTTQAKQFVRAKQLLT